MNLYLVRHGLARSNLDDPASCPFDPVFAPYEAADCSLTPQGVRQAALTGERLAGVSFDAAFSSPLHRALSTAAEILRRQKRAVPLEILPDLVECGTAPYVRLPAALLLRIWPEITPLPAPGEEGKTVDPGVAEESPEAAADRADRVAGRILGCFSGEENVLVVSHGGFLHRYLCQAFLGLPRELRSRYWLSAENACITKFHFLPDGVVNLVTVDETGHLGETRSREPFDL